MAGKYQTYPEYKDSGVRGLGSIPANWEVMQLKRTVSRCVNGIWGAEPKQDGDDTIVLRVADFDRPKLSIQNDGYTLRKIDDKEKLTRKLKRGDLLLEKSGGGEKTLVGQVVLFDKEFEAVTSNFVAKMTPNLGFNSRFLNYVFSRFYSDNINFCSIKQNTGIQNLDSSAYLAEKFGFPAEYEQQKIANFLDHETAKIDTLIEKQQQLIALLKEKRQAVISHAVTKGLNANAPMRDSGVEWLGEVPEHWDVAKVKYFATIQGGYAFSSGSFQESGVQLLRIGNVYLNRLALERQPTFVDKTFVKSHKSFSVVRGDILMSLTGTLGKTDYGFAVHVDEDGPFMLNQRVAKITPINSKIAPEYLIYAIRSESYLKQLYSLPSGTKQANLSNDDVTNIPIVVPPTLKEQQLVAQYISDNLEKYNKVIEKSEAAIKLIQERRTALISAAVTGEIDVRDFNPKNAETC